MQQDSAEQNNAITADQVSQFLRSHSHFFEQHASLLTEIYLPSPHGNGAISLAERQQLAQRDKIRVLEAMLAQMIESAKQNDSTSSKVHNLSVRLISSLNFADLQQIISQTMQQDFSVTQSLVRLWEQPSNSDLAQDDAFTEMGSDFNEWAISLNQPVCGAKPQVANDLLDADLMSFAFIPLYLVPNSSQASGVLILAAQDEQRFKAEMGTMYLSLIGELISVALARHI
jgi:uncharacterized protein YigA (DUF484 family)